MPKKIPFPQVITALLDKTAIFPPQMLHRFNDLPLQEIRSLSSAWPNIEPSRRRALLEDLEELAASDTLLLFDNVARLGLNDSEAGVRATAIRMLWESGDVKLIPTLLRALETDPSPEVRAEAASALGNYIYLGELEELDARHQHKAEEHLLKVMQGSDDTLVRRRALESLGFSSRSEIPALIQAAYDSRDLEWMASALYAMGRSFDPAWEAPVRRELRSPNAKVQLEAVRAAGELNLDTARRALLNLLEDDSTDSEIRAAAIWSLSQIGGEEVREALEAIVEESDDEEEVEWVEEALDNLTLTEQVQPQLDFFNIDLADKEHYGKVIDLEHEDETLDPADDGTGEDGPDPDEKEV